MKDFLDRVNDLERGMKNIPMIEVLMSKLQRVEVTQSDVNYKGSITIDEDLMDRLFVVPYQKCIINGMQNRNDITYVIPGKRGSGIIGINGALSTRHEVGDIIHVLFFVTKSISTLSGHHPDIVITDDNNKFVKYDD